MCDCDAPKVSSTIIRTARKKHKCCECHREIVVGESYEYISGIWETAMNFKTCKSCVDLREQVITHLDLRYDCAPCFGNLLEAAKEMELV
jgi:hypothetical protein